MAAADWREEYKKALRRTVIRRGTLIDQHASFYGWRDWDDRHFGSQRDCHVEAVGDPVEQTWDEFMGTFYEGDTTKHGVEIEISCTCGQMRGRHMRLDATVSDVIKWTLEEDDGEGE